LIGQRRAVALPEGRTVGIGIVQSAIVSPELVWPWPWPS
jgi:hypothetical protein